ncbi:transcription initiation factor IID, 18kD subunit-domain-containing protein [Fusarium avenaceum]|nr:transcription initiation factor IID, 18kD subunit-domain-containing protein [Fusarium avenaceum]
MDNCLLIMERLEPKYKLEIQQMMFVAGETQDPSPDTLTLVEDIIRDQVILLLTTASELAARRGSRTFSSQDLIFQVRHDTVRVTRLQTFLRWKAIRKTVRDDDEKAQLDFAAENIVDEALGGSSTDTVAKNTQSRAVILPWDVQTFFCEQPPGGKSNEELIAESSVSSLDKLRWADEQTTKMTADEYIRWTEYRHASFTWRKVKRFREWSGLGTIADHKPTDDSLDILGFLTCEMVQKLTEVALSIQRREIITSQRMDMKPAMSQVRDNEGPFAPSSLERSAISVRHIRQAFEATQTRAKRQRVSLNKSSIQIVLKLI